MLYKIFCRNQFRLGSVSDLVFLNAKNVSFTHFKHSGNRELSVKEDDTHSLPLLLLPLLGISFGLLLRLLPGFFFFFEFLYSRVTAVGSICRYGTTCPSDSTELCYSCCLSCSVCLLALYQLVFVFCSSLPSSSELSKLDSASRSTSSHLDWQKEWHACQSDTSAVAQYLNCDAAQRRNLPLSLFLFLFIQVGEFSPWIKVVPVTVNHLEVKTLLCSTHFSC